MIQRDQFASVSDAGPWVDALHRHSVSAEQLLHTLRDEIGLSADTPVFLAGSIVEGFANSASDIDLYAIVDGGLPEAAEGTHHTLIRTSYAKIDLVLIARSEMNALLHRFERFKRSGCVDAILADSFSVNDRHTLDRLKTGLAVQGHEALDHLRNRLGGDALARHRFTCAFAMIKRRQAAAEALRREGDWRTLLLVLRDIVDACADALLAVADDTNISLKWRIHQLERAYPPDAPSRRAAPASAARDGPRSASRQPAGDPASLFLSLSIFPSEPDFASTMTYAYRVMAWARRVVLFATSAFYGGQGDYAFLELPAGTRSSNPLHLDTVVGCAGEAFAASRLSESAPAIQLSADAASILCALDPFDHRAFHPAGRAYVYTNDQAVERLKHFSTGRGLFATPPQGPAS